MGRPSTSCVACAKRKIRCDKRKPQCGPCSDRKIKCESSHPGRFRILREDGTGKSRSASQSRRDNEPESTSSPPSTSLLPFNPSSPLDHVDESSHHLQIFTRGPSATSRSKMDANLLPCMMEMSDACRYTFLLATRAHYDTIRNISEPCQDVLKLKDKCFKLLKHDINKEWKYSPTLGFAIANLAGASFIYGLPDEDGQFARAQTALQRLILDEVGTKGMMKRSAFDLMLLKTVIMNLTFPSLLTGDLFQSPFALCDYSDSWPRLDPGDKHVRESPLYCPANLSTLKKVSSSVMLDLLRLVRKCLDCIIENIQSAQLDSFYKYANQIRKLASRPNEPEYESIRLSIIIIIEAVTKGISFPEAVKEENYVQQLRVQLERSNLRQCWCEEKMGVLWWVLIVGCIASIESKHRPFFWTWLQFMAIQFLGGQPNWWSSIVPVRRMRVIVHVALQGSVRPDAYQSLSPESQEDAQGALPYLGEPINSYTEIYP